METLSRPALEQSLMLAKNHQVVSEDQVKLCSPTALKLIAFPNSANESDGKALSAQDTSIVLSIRPNLISKMDISKLQGFEIGRVLSSNPYLLDCFDLKALDGTQRQNFLRAAPQLFRVFKTEELSVNERCELVKRYPAQAHNLHFSSMQNNHQVEVLKARPELINLSNKNQFSKFEWLNLLIEQPSLMEQCNIRDFALLDKKLLVDNHPSKFPQFAKELGIKPKEASNHIIKPVASYLGDGGAELILYSDKKNFYISESLFGWDKQEIGSTSKVSLEAALRYVEDIARNSGCSYKKAKQMDHLFVSPLNTQLLKNGASSGWSANTNVKKEVSYDQVHLYIENDHGELLRTNNEIPVGQIKEGGNNWVAVYNFDADKYVAYQLAEGNKISKEIDLTGNPHTARHILGEELANDKSNFIQNKIFNDPKRSVRENFEIKRSQKHAPSMSIPSNTRMQFRSYG